MENIGMSIMELRKAKGVTQESLAEIVGVSIQAVSKWENGGCPDTALLPTIADFFEVPIDALFGRDPDKYSDIRQKVRQALFSKAVAKEGDLSVLGGTREMAQDFFEICFAVNQLFIAPDLKRHMETTAEVLEETKTDSKPHLLSRNIVDGCTTLMNLKGSPYFMLMTEPKDGWRSGLMDIEKYNNLFGILSDYDTLKTILWICERPVSSYGDSKKPLTKKGIQDKLGFSEEQTTKQIEILLNLKLITQQDIELDDVVTATYSPTLAQTPVLPLLVIANELINPLPSLNEKGYYGHRWNNGRTLIDMDSSNLAAAVNAKTINNIRSVLGVDFEILPEHFGPTRSFNNNGLILSWKFLDLQGYTLNPEDFAHNDNGNVFGSKLGDVFICISGDSKLYLYIDVGSSEWGRAYNNTLLD